MTDSELNGVPEMAPRARIRRSQGKKPKHPIVVFLLDIIGVIGFALILSLLIKSFVVRSFYIPSESMQTTLMVNDRIVVSEFYPTLIPISRGDVVVFKDPGGWLRAASDVEKPWYDLTADWVLSSFGVTAPDSDNHLVKRVIGLPGDHIVCCDAEHRLSINGVTIDESYVKEGVHASDKEFDVTVPADSYWVMGDNRSNSADSRFHLNLPSKGFVGREFIVGKAFVLTWPFERFTLLDNHSDVFANVPKP